MKDNLKDRIKELIKSGEHEDLIFEALASCIDEYSIENDKNLKCDDYLTVKKPELLGADILQALTPKKKPVDMSVLVDSPIDCVFWTSEETSNLIGEYCRPYKGDYFIAGHGTFKYCKPRMNYPFSYDLLENSIDRIQGFIVNLQMSGFNVDHFTALIDDEKAYGSFRITGLQKNRCWPWECE